MWTLQQFLLLALIGIPAGGAILIGLLPGQPERWMRLLGATMAFATLLVWLALVFSIPDRDGLLVSVHVGWIEEFGSSLHLGFDHRGLVFSGIITFLGVVSIVGTLSPEPRWDRMQVVCLLLAEMGMLGVLMSWDLLVFIVFWELTLIPFFFLMGHGPTVYGVSAATRFFVTSITSSVLMWIGVLWIVREAGSPYTFDLVSLTTRFEDRGFPEGVGLWLFTPAFLARMACFPLHTWFPTAVASVQPAAGIMLTGGVLPLGGYGFLHVLVRLLGQDLGEDGHWFVGIGILTALGCAFASVVQRDLKKLLAYVCLSHSGIVLFALTYHAGIALWGGTLLLVALGISGACLFLVAGIVCSARGSQRIADISGLWRAHPGFAAFAFPGFASMAVIPGTIGFIGSFVIFQKLAVDLGLLALVVLAVSVTSFTSLWTYRRIVGGSFQPDIWLGFKWRKRQVSVVFLVSSVVLALGFLPGLLPLDTKSLTKNIQNGSPKTSDSNEGKACP